MNIQQLKTHWVFSLQHVVIAGGFFRDSFLGIPVRDIDIYCLPVNLESVRRQINFRIAEDITKKPPKIVTDQTNEQKYARQNGIDIDELSTYRTWQGETLDLIVTNAATSSLDLIKTFDYTVNAIAWPGENEELSYSTNTLRDLWAMRLTVIDNPTEVRKRYMISKGFKE